MSHKEVINRLTKHIGGEAVLADCIGVGVEGGSVGDATFTVRYRLGRSLFVAVGKVLDGLSDRLVLVRFTRRPYSRVSIALGLIGGWGWIAYSSTGHGGFYFDPLRWAIGMVSTISAGVVLPKLGAIPAELPEAVGRHLAMALLGEVE